MASEDYYKKEIDRVQKLLDEANHKLEFIKSSIRLAGQRGAIYMQCDECDGLGKNGIKKCSACNGMGIKVVNVR